MFSRLRHHWQDFLKSQPGKRFQERYVRRQREGHGPSVKWLCMIAGLAVCACGVILLFIPRPGSLLLLIGAGMVAQESYVVSRMLDWLEVKARALVQRLRRA